MLQRELGKPDPTVKNAWIANLLHASAYECMYAVTEPYYIFMRFRDFSEKKFFYRTPVLQSSVTSAELASLLCKTVTLTAHCVFFTYNCFNSYAASSHAQLIKSTVFMYRSRLAVLDWHVPACSYSIDRLLMRHNYSRYLHVLTFFGFLLTTYTVRSAGLRDRPC
jgi:hypothetical protein